MPTCSWELKRLEKIMKYIIFICELIAMVLLFVFSPISILLKIIGAVIIVCISQYAHTVLKAR